MQILEQGEVMEAEDAFETAIAAVGLDAALYLATHHTPG